MPNVTLSTWGLLLLPPHPTLSTLPTLPTLPKLIAPIILTTPHVHTNVFHTLELDIAKAASNSTVPLVPTFPTIPTLTPHTFHTQDPDIAKAAGHFTVLLAPALVMDGVDQCCRRYLSAQVWIHTDLYCLTHTSET